MPPDFPAASCDPLFGITTNSASGIAAAIATHFVARSKSRRRAPTSTSVGIAICGRYSVASGRAANPRSAAATPSGGAARIIRRCELRPIRGSRWSVAGANSLGSIASARRTRARSRSTCLGQLVTCRRRPRASRRTARVSQRAKPANAPAVLSPELKADVAAHRQSAKHDRLVDSKASSMAASRRPFVPCWPCPARPGCRRSLAGRVRSRCHLCERSCDLRIPHGVVERKTVDQQHAAVPRRARTTRSSIGPAGTRCVMASMLRIAWSL